jgi:hypothetical protein
MINRGNISLLAALALAMAGAACTSEPGSVADGLHARSWVDATMVNELKDRGDVIVTNEQKGWYR